MIPLRDDNPTRRAPYIVYCLIAVNVILFVYNGTMASKTGGPLGNLALVPRALTMGASSGVHIPVPAWVTIFTSMFLHANWLHLLGNMLYLWIFGNNIEDTLGHLKFLAFYLIAGVGAAMAHVLVSAHSTAGMVGASGAIAGVLGAYVVLFPRARVVTLLFLFYFIRLVELPASLVLGFWIVLQVINGAVMTGAGVHSGVAYAAHVGGFAAGILIILALGGRRMLSAGRPTLYGNQNLQ